jgi:hypothetical protein
MSDSDSDGSSSSESDNSPSHAAAEDDPFTFKRVKFGSKKNVKIVQQAKPASDDDDDDDDENDVGSGAQGGGTKPQTTSNVDDDDDDDDSSDSSSSSEDESPRSKKRGRPKKKSPKSKRRKSTGSSKHGEADDDSDFEQQQQQASSSSASGSRGGSANNAAVLDDSSDSDDNNEDLDLDALARSGDPKAKELIRMRNAREALQAANEARRMRKLEEDIEIIIDSDSDDDNGGGGGADDSDSDVEICGSSAAPQHSGNDDDNYSGPTVTLTVRPNGNQKAAISVHKIPTLLPLQPRILAAYCKRTGLSESQIIGFEFDGDAVAGKVTSESLDMEDGDIVEVKLKPGVAIPAGKGNSSSSSSSSSSASQQTAAEAGDRIKLNVRINGSSQNMKSYSLRKTDKFQKIYDALQKVAGVGGSVTGLYLDGDRLNPNADLEGEGLEGEEILECKMVLGGEGGGSGGGGGGGSSSSSSSSSAKAEGSSSSAAAPNPAPPAASFVVTLVRNNNTASQSHKFKVTSATKLQVLKDAYIRLYAKNKTAKNVKIYYNGNLIQWGGTVKDIGWVEGSFLMAFDNNKKP